jgi:choline monooxygenase
MAPQVDINPDIRRAATLPAGVYYDPRWYELQRERVFARTWQYAGEAARVRAPGHVLPFTLLE